MRTPGVYEHGTIQKYRQGCSCADCKRAKRENNNAQRGKGVPRSGVVALDTIAEPGEVEKAVLAETRGLSAVAERPGALANALAMAKILDNPGQMAMHPTASRQLTAILSDLRTGSKRQAGRRLAAVRAMTPKAQVG